MPEPRMRLGLTRPTPVVFATLITLVVVFVVMALAVRFSDAGKAIYSFLVLDPQLVIEEGRVWTMLTSSLLHSLDSPGHLLANCLGFYFFGPAMESRWGSRKFVGFMALAALMGSLFVLATYLLGLGSAPVVGASAITMGILMAWGLTFPDREVFLFFILPLKGIHIVYASIALEVLNALSFSSVSAAGHFGGMFAGFLVGEASPLRRYFLKMRLRRLEAQAAALRASSPKGRAGGPPLRVIQGGQKAPPKDKRYLN
jgi:membrane associated rhomboid family serine protease